MESYVYETLSKDKYSNGFDSNVNRDGWNQGRENRLHPMLAQMSRSIVNSFLSLLLTCIIMNPNSLHGGLLEGGGLIYQKAAFGWGAYLKGA